MKRTSLLFAVFALLFLMSCGKYEDGPGFSLRSKKARIVGNWTVEKYYEDGVDVTSDVLSDGSTIVVEFREDGSYSSTITNTVWGQSVETGTWDLSDDKEYFSTTESDGDVYTVRILRLTNNEIWFEDTSSETLDEIHLVAK
jgi:hypothetical protein